MAKDNFGFPILIGDIGGTNARFAILPDSLAEPIRFEPVHTADFPTLANAIQDAVLDRTTLHPKTAILAVAGVVEGDRFKLTNSHWVIEPRALLDMFRLADLVFLNDFEAQALAAASLEVSDLEQIGGSGIETDAPRVVLGPGTGLGVAGLIRVHDFWVPVAGEGGHVDIGPRGADEARIFASLETLDGRISAEHVLSGRGLVHLYRAVCRMRSAAAGMHESAEISAAALNGTDPCAGEALKLFVTLLGRLAGDLALIFMSRGGVYIAGGIARKILPAFRESAFRAAFEDKVPHSARLADIPVFVITHRQPALAGLTAYARTPGLFWLDLEGRHWR